jgi:hypothetical protein
MPGGAVVFVLGLMGAAGVAAAANKKKEGAPPGAKQVELDDSLPPATAQQVIGALSHERDPAALETLAAQMDGQGYHLTAQALREHAAELRALPAAPASAAPTTLPATAPSPAAAPGAPALDAVIDATTLSAVLRALAIERDPAVLVRFAESIRAQYPIAASLLLGAAGGLGGSPAAATGPTLDPGLTTTERAAVLQALATSEDAEKLIAFAQTLQAHAPIAAGLLLAKAESLRKARLPTPSRPRPAPPHPHPHDPPAPGIPAPAPTPPTYADPWAPGADITGRMDDHTAHDFVYALGTWLSSSGVLNHHGVRSRVDLSWWQTPAPEHVAPEAPPHALPSLVPAPHVEPSPPPHDVVPSACPFALVDGAACIDATRALAAAPHGFTTPRTWPPAMTTQANTIHNNHAAPDGVYFVFYKPDGGLYRFTKTTMGPHPNTVLASSHDVDVSVLGMAGAPATPATPSHVEPAPHPAPAPHLEPSPAPAPSSAAVCPFPLQPGVTCLDAPTAMRAAAGPFSTPKTWTPVMTAQARAVNASSLTPPGVYYVFCSQDGALYKLTKARDASGKVNTTLQSTHAVNKTAFATSGYDVGAAAPEAPGLAALDDPAHFPLAIQALQEHAKALRYAAPPGLPGSRPRVLDAQTYLTLIGWLSAHGLDAVAQGRASSAAWGSQSGALPAFTAQVRGGPLAKGHVPARPGPGHVTLQARA